MSTRVLPRYLIGDPVKCYKRGELFRMLGGTPLGRALALTCRLLETALSLF